jgi:general secretion pathway protein L
MRQLLNTQLKAIEPWLNMVSKFWLWWSSELSNLIPEPLKQSGQVSAGNVSICFRNAEVSMHRKVKGKEDNSCSFTMIGDSVLTDDSLYHQGDKVILELADGFYLQKRISLPSAAAENLRGVLEFEMDRHTPFQASQVYFDFHLVSRRSEDNKIVVDLVAAPRKAIDKLLEILSKSEIPVDAISLEKSKGLPTFNLLERKPVNKSRFKTRLDNFQLAVLLTSVLLSIAVVTVPI